VRAVVQRAESASVSVEGNLIGSIDQGLVVFLGVSKSDSEAECRWLADKIMGLRIFEDAEGKMNLSLVEVGGGALLIPNFTVCGDAAKGRRPSFESAASFEEGMRLFEKFVANCRDSGLRVEVGQFGADMEVMVVNDGPVTLILGSP
jgi:D-tyrosyl-tRNA(Tyr) deacylase